MGCGPAGLLGCDRGLHPGRSFDAMALNLVDLDPALRQAIEDGRSRMAAELARVAQADGDLLSVPAESERPLSA